MAGQQGQRTLISPCSFSRCLGDRLFSCVDTTPGVELVMNTKGGLTAGPSCERRSARRVSSRACAPAPRESNAPPARRAPPPCWTAAEAARGRCRRWEQARARRRGSRSPRTAQAPAREQAPAQARPWWWWWSRFPCSGSAWSSAEARSWGRRPSALRAQRARQRTAAAVTAQRALMRQCSAAVQRRRATPQPREAATTCARTIRLRARRGGGDRGFAVAAQVVVLAVRVRRHGAVRLARRQRRPAIRRRCRRGGGVTPACIRCWHRCGHW